MSAYSDFHLAAARANWLAFATEICDIYDPPAETKSPGGGRVKPTFPDDFTSLGLNVPCRFDSTMRRAEAGVKSGVVQVQADYKVEVPWDQAVSDRSTLVITSRGSLKLEARKVRHPGLLTHLIVEADEN